MSLELIIPPAGEPVSLDEAKAHLRVTHGEEDGLIAVYLMAARRAVEARTGLAVLAQTWRLVLDRAPPAPLALPRGPVASVSAVETVMRDGSASLVPPDLYDVETGLGARLAPRGPWPHTDRLIGGVRIEFAAGWPDAAAVPEEIRHAIRLLAAHFYEHREAVATERAAALPQAVEALLSPFRRARL
ncbi:MAG: head-tail connector protein [Amphiplicatus sp.]